MTEGGGALKRNAGALYSQARCEALSVMPRLVLIPTLLLALSAALPAAAQDSELWRMVAQSDVIAAAVVEMPGDRPEAAEYVEVPLRSVRVLKGYIGARPAIRWYSEPRPSAPSVEQLHARSNSPSIVFAVRNEDQLYFASAPAALQPADTATVAAVEAEIARQAEALVNWQIDPGVPHFAEVRAIIEEIVALPSPSRDERRSGATRQQRLFDRLVALGPGAVPAIIEQMDDDRALSSPAISLVNHAPDAFEAFRQHAPKVVVDALAAVLNQLTGENFGFIYNGATTAERAASVSGWRIYLDHIRNAAVP